jgi:hypothetical protein
MTDRHGQISVNQPNEIGMEHITLLIERLFQHTSC